ncbi:hypothetical protein OCH239_21040 [Roseivivax halodurans JCM 10272]|uniref:Thiol:disulfide interchange protein DsbD N-terminal domain-containing protein n=1 Tax=Roseivivax halodurans JCM 10272 TaxID=1449350 RepID=X7EG42_9RHOB|nr:protein-disulfide reductase DsbD domain-containing protein [Roseivivax halodurans]ETX14840.1 hypothetical protein OCH239_21040 [Roseivivax halodurans JCM 10272]
MKRLAALALAATLLPFTAVAEQLSDVVSATLRPGWRQADGTHVAALQLRLAPGWKTYWRAPGDAGIPPEFDWSGSSNMDALSVTWPAPHVFHRSGLRSVGYSDEVVLPLVVTARGGGDVRLGGEVRIGVCEDICLPATLRVDGVLPASATKPDPVIAAALAQRPFTEGEAGVGAVRCSISAGAGSGMGLRAEIEMPRLGSGEEIAIETGNPAIWVDDPEASRIGDRLVAETRLEHVDGSAFALDRSAVRFTVMADGQAVDIRGCTG